MVLSHGNTGGYMKSAIIAMVSATASLLALWGKFRKPAAVVVNRRYPLENHKMKFVKKIMVVCVAVTGSTAQGQVTRLIEGFEFASSEQAATLGVTDLTDSANFPTLYTNGAGPGEGGATEGENSLGTDGLFGGEDGIFVPGSVLGFRRQIDTDLFPTGEVVLLHSYGDPNVTGAVPADKPLDELEILGDFYGSKEYGEGLTGTHLWINLLDAEGERFNFINYSEASLFQDGYTLDVLIGLGEARLDPDSLIEVPDGDRLLTEIVAIEVLLQDDDDPPTGAGKWYIDNLRIREAEAAAVPGDTDNDGDVDVFDFLAFEACELGPEFPLEAGCEGLDFDEDGDVDFGDFSTFQRFVTGGF